MPGKSNKFTTLGGAADEMEISLRTVRRMISSGQLRAYRIGNTKAVRILREDLDKLLKPVVPNGKC